MTAVIARIDRILFDLDELAEHFEGAGFTDQSDHIDLAADNVVNLRNELEELASFSHARRRRNRKTAVAHA